MLDCMTPIVFIKESIEPVFIVYYQLFIVQFYSIYRVVNLFAQMCITFRIAKSY